ncbi:MAG: glycosyltransferase [Acidimicrobiales bacterium]
MTEQSKPRWSIVIPAYMPGENLEVAVDSVIAAMAGRHDFEVVVVDDASPDPISLTKYGPPVRVDRNDQNLGAVANFNRAIDRALGELIHVLHADDYVQTGFYETLESGLETEGVVAAACGVQRVDGKGMLIETMKPELAAADVWPQAFERLAVANRLPAVSIVAKRTTYEAVGDFDESLVHAADWDLWIRFSRAGDFFYDPSPLATYRVHDAQHTASLASSGKNIDEAIEVIERLPSRVGSSEARQLMTRAFLYRAVYAARSSGRALRAGHSRTAAIQIGASLRCALLGARTFVFGPGRRES